MDVDPENAVKDARSALYLDPLNIKANYIAAQAKFKIAKKSLPRKAEAELNSTIHYIKLGKTHKHKKTSHFFIKIFTKK